MTTEHAGQQLTIDLLGAPVIAVDGAPISVDTRKAVALIAHLGLNPGVQMRDGLATLLWPELDQSRARAALRRTLSALNRTALARWLSVTRTSIELRVDEAVQIDVLTFDRLIDACDAHGHPADRTCPRCIDPLTAAVALYRDDFMAGFTLRDSVNFDDWQFFTAEELRRDFVNALDRLTDALIGVGRFDDAIETARRRLHADPLHEAAHRQLMRLFVWTDRRNAALRQYQECVRVLDEELGVSPLDETVALHETIYANRPLPRPQSSPDQSPLPSPAAPPAVDLSPAARPVADVELVGRETDWATLDAALAQIHSGHLVIVEGEAGIGKTALVERFLAYAATRGCATLRVQCYRGESELAYAPMRELLRAGLRLPDAGARLAALAPQWLTDIGRLLPEVAGAAPQLPPDQPGLDDQAAKGRFFEAVNQLVGALAVGPTCIAIDNLHWADHATLELVGYLARRLAGRPICLALIWRSEELAGNDLRRITGVDAIDHIGKSEVTPARLTARDVHHLLGAARHR